MCSAIARPSGNHTRIGPLPSPLSSSGGWGPSKADGRRLAYQSVIEEVVPLALRAFLCAWSVLCFSPQHGDLRSGCNHPPRWGPKSGVGARGGRGPGMRLSGEAEEIAPSPSCRRPFSGLMRRLRQEDRPPKSRPPETFLGANLVESPHRNRPKPARTSKRNPPWERDELILALDLYVRAGRKVLDGRHPDVIALSELLNALPIHAVRPDAAKFRNGNGVNLKLANFRSIDQPGRGMQRGNREEKPVWAEFAHDPSKLGEVAAATFHNLSARAGRQPGLGSLAVRARAHERRP
jgi:hypothetical protein